MEGRSEEIGLLLRSLLEVTLQAAQELEGEEPDPDTVEALLHRRNRLFAQLQGVVGEGEASRRPDPESQAKWAPLVEEILKVDRRCIELAQAHLERIQGRLDQLKLRRRTLSAYGWAKAPLTSRGSFVDRTNR